jgi:ESS family glutamate:Na+ symporter
MVVATMMSIQFGLLITFLVPIVLVCVAVSLGTALMCFLLGRQLQHLGIERALTIFGCCCGSTGTGLLLLRIVDPDFSTPIAKELAFFNIAILIAGFHILTLMAPILPSYDISTIVSVYAATLIAGGIIALLIGRRVPAHTA